MARIDLVDDELVIDQPVAIERAKTVLNDAGLEDLATLKADATQSLNRSGASVSECSQVIAQLMVYSESDAIKFNAAKEALKLHGVYGASAEEDGKVVFVIQGNAQLNQVFNPKRTLNNAD